MFIVARVAPKAVLCPYAWAGNTKKYPQGRSMAAEKPHLNISAYWAATWLTEYSYYLVLFDCSLVLI